MTKMRHKILVMVLTAAVCGFAAKAQTAPATTPSAPAASPSAPSPAAASPSFGAAAMQMLMAPRDGKLQFLLRFTPPRATFATDMTPDETQAMMGQVLYWRSQQASGKVLLLGAVNDPKGLYGMVIVETASEAEAKALADADPSVKAGVNKVEIAPMRVVLKKE